MKLNDVLLRMNDEKGKPAAQRALMATLRDNKRISEMFGKPKTKVLTIKEEEQHNKTGFFTLKDFLNDLDNNSEVVLSHENSSPMFGGDGGKQEIKQATLYQFNKNQGGVETRGKMITKSLTMIKDDLKKRAFSFIQNDKKPVDASISRRTSLRLAVQTVTRRALSLPP